MTSRVGFYRPLGGAPLEDNVNQTYLKATGFSADGSKPSPMISPVDEAMWIPWICGTKPGRTPDVSRFKKNWKQTIETATIIYRCFESQSPGWSEIEMRHAVLAHLLDCACRNHLLRCLLQKASWLRWGRQEVAQKDGDFPDRFDYLVAHPTARGCELSPQVQVD